MEIELEGRCEEEEAAAGGPQVSAGSVPRNVPVAADPQAFPGVRFTPTSLEIEGALTLEAWIHLMRVLGDMAAAIAWWVGDALLWGERAFGEECYQAADPERREQLQSWVRVASRVPRKVRNERLTWSHHRAVASLDDPREQERWLEYAEIEGLRSGELSSRIRALHARPTPKGQLETEEQPAPEDEPQAPRCEKCGGVITEEWLMRHGWSRRRRPDETEPDLARTKLDRSYWPDQARIDVEGEDDPVQAELDYYREKAAP